MTRLRDELESFDGAIALASERLALADLFVEKDYWVTQVLRALHELYRNAFVFKGGTSLSKGYGLIDRFSEDVDILVTPQQGDSAARRESRLGEMVEGVALALDVAWIEARPPGHGRQAHRADVLVYPRLSRSGGLSAPFEDRGVLLETGFAGGEWPTEMVTLTPLLNEPLGIKPGDYEDTDAFELRALKPVRTLLEKVSLLHHAATLRDAGDPTDARCGRHYYDVYRLLGDRPTLVALEDRAHFERMVSEMRDISDAHYGGSTSRPTGGYAEGLAFSPEHGSELREWLEARYGDAAGLLPAGPGSRWPNFGQVLKRVEESSHLL